MKKIIAITTAAIMGLGALFWVDQKPVPLSPELEKLSLGVESSLLTAAVWVAEHNGYFQEEGLDLTIKPFDSGRASFKAMLADEGVDISTVAPTPIMFDSFNRMDFSVVATFVHSMDDLKVIACSMECREGGINSVADLLGKRIGTPFGTTGQYFVDSFLTFHEINVSDVELVDIPPSELATALNNKQVDAIVIWEPHAKYQEAPPAAGDQPAQLNYLLGGIQFHSHE